eukprot:CAMPEP_0195288690 /NCGR_PEP_ID=MMETSP0707-20130614/5257_1 /TAXON_ID=33640 /ORGANISM="Asterionellopsis glacialis, Strain CCMP134" /LENGTH=488 /DNA_ID=CAMNT_0040348589 /DNA_START=105 /DNA_END=1571 /DNA_ORIENTATION=-
MVFPISPVSTSSCSSSVHSRARGIEQQQQQQQQQQQPQSQHPVFGQNPSPQHTSKSIELSQEQQLAEDQLIAMLHVESQYKIPNMACRRSSSLTFEEDVAGADGPHEEWRRKICEWSFKVVDHFRYDREVVSVAMNIFDRFLLKLQQQQQQQQQQQHSSPQGSFSPTGTASFDNASLQSSSSTCCNCVSCHPASAVDSRTFQLSAMTSLYLAIKLSSDNNNDHEYSRYNHENDNYNHKHVINTNRRKKLRLLSFVDLSRGQFTPQDISTMEQRILNVLGWKVNPTTPMTLVAQLLTCMPLPSSPEAQRHYDLVLHVINELSRYITELSVCLANIACVYQPSQVAYASILISMDMLTTKALPLETRAQFFEWIRATTSSSGVTLHPQDDTIYYLKNCLQRSFLPEVLMEDINMEPQHPVYIAREAGLLDVGFANHAATTGSCEADVPPTTQHQQHLGRNPSSTSVMEQHMQDMHLQQEQQRRSILCVTP